MVTQELIEELIRKRLKRVLSFARVGLMDRQFEEFRKLTLDEFGQSGLVKDLERVFQERRDKARHGQA